MALKIKSSHMVAVVIAAAIAGWMYTGKVVVGGKSPDASHAETIASRNAGRVAKPFRVKYITARASQREKIISIRGRTEAKAKVPVRAQVSGVLLERLVDRGAFVNEGQPVCRLELGDIQARLAQAKAALTKAQVEFEANKKLADKGFTAKTRMHTYQAALDAAKASLAQVQLQMSRTEIKANASGIVQDPVAEAGDMLSPGGVCVTLLQPDPMKFVGQVSERDIGEVKVGTQATIALVSGEKVSGTVRYIAHSADPKTRTFLTEIEMNNAKGAIRDGLTAKAVIKLKGSMAFRLSPSWITLSDTGDIGVRVIDDQNIVSFVKLKVIARTKEGFWVTGLRDGQKVISFGQDYVIAGNKVDPVADTISAGDLES